MVGKLRTVVVLIFVVAEAFSFIKERGEIDFKFMADDGYVVVMAEIVEPGTPAETIGICE